MLLSFCIGRIHNPLQLTTLKEIASKPAQNLLLQSVTADGKRIRASAFVAVGSAAVSPHIIAIVVHNSDGSPTTSVRCIRQSSAAEKASAKKIAFASFRPLKTSQLAAAYLASHFSLRLHVIPQRVG